MFDLTGGHDADAPLVRLRIVAKDFALGQRCERRDAFHDYVIFAVALGTGPGKHTNAAFDIDHVLYDDGRVRR